MTAGLDLALRLVERKHDKSFATRVAGQIEYAPQGAVHVRSSAADRA